MKEIANSSKAKFEYWVQEKWNVLPTDQRWLDLTDEQLDLLFEHYMRLNPAKDDTDNKWRDPDYDDEENGVSSGGAVINEVEQYEDPDFDEAWNATDEELPNDIIGENPPKDDFETIGEHVETDVNTDIDDFEEV